MVRQTLVLTGALGLRAKANESGTSTSEMNFLALLIQIVVGTIIVAPVLWLAGRALAGKGRAKFTHAIWIVVLGTVIGRGVTSVGGHRTTRLKPSLPNLIKPKPVFVYVSYVV